MASDQSPQSECVALSAVEQSECVALSAFEISPGYTKYWIPVCSPAFKPYCGMYFETLAEGIAFYKSYASICGFNYRKSTTSKLRNGSMRFQYLLCSKEGFKNLKDDNVANSDGKKKMLATRVGCKAKMVLRHHGNGFIVWCFEERHTHPFVSDASKPFLKNNRHLDLVHQQFILTWARAIIGPVKTYRIFKESIGAYGDIGATVVDFKNFRRDLNAYMSGVDAQLMIDNLFRRQEISTGFYFEYDTNGSDELTRLFWCDAVSRKNYALFGDIVSFDTTYSTNKYNMLFTPFTGVDNHKKSVTFAAALLSKEDVPSYSWLFKAFKNAMHHAPSCIVTDQDPSMKKSIEVVFPTTRHRLYMWHIMNKLLAKMIASSHVVPPDDNFMKKFCALVWRTDLDPVEFDSKWNALIHGYGYDVVDWFIQLYQMRHSWLPAYFRDFAIGGLIKTTSRSESENFFFGHFVNKSLSLVEFLMHFDSAIDAQRHSHAKLVSTSELSAPPLKTPLLIEKCASELYTLEFFYDFQQQLLETCFSCNFVAMAEDAPVQKYTIDDKDHKLFYVVYVVSDGAVTCSCKLFQSIGLPCRHIMLVLKHKGITAIPQNLIVGRWFKDSDLSPVFMPTDNIIEQSAIAYERKSLINQLWGQFHSCISASGLGLKKLLTAFTEQDSSSSSGQSVSSHQSKASVIESFVGGSRPTQVRVHDPQQSKTKGSGRRIKSTKEKAMEDKLRSKRLCSICKEYVSGHNSRTCPLKKKP